MKMRYTLLPSAATTLELKGITFSTPIWDTFEDKLLKFISEDR